MREESDSGINLIRLCEIACDHAQPESLIGQRVRFAGEEFTGFTTIRSVSGQWFSKHDGFFDLVTEPVLLRLSYHREEAGFAEIARIEREQGGYFKSLTAFKDHEYLVCRLTYNLEAESWFVYAEFTPLHELLVLHDFQVAKILQEKNEYHALQGELPKILPPAKMKIEVDVSFLR